MLKLVQKVISFKPSDFIDDAEWSNNILPPDTVAYELTIGSDAGNKFALDESKYPFIIQTTEDGSVIPLTINRHKVPIQSLHVHRENKYTTMPTIINMLILVDEKNLDQWLDEVSNLTQKIELMDEELLFLEEQINPEAWSNRNNNLSMASAIGGWGDMFEGEQVGNNSVWDITTAILQGLIWNDTYLK